MYVHSKNSLPMDVEFLLYDSLEVCQTTTVKERDRKPTDIPQAVRPRMHLFKSFEEAAVAVDEMFNTAFQNAGCK